MTVAVESPIIKYTYTAPAVLSFNFKVYLETDLVVHFIDENSAVTVLSLTTDYTVALNPSLDGGDVTLTYVPPGGYGPPDVYIHIFRQLPRSQVTDWVNNNPFNMDLLETDLDRAIMLIQEVETSLSEILATSEWKGDWATGLYYSIRDMVIESVSGNYYMAAEAHTSGTFATDLAAGKWILYIDVGELGGYVAAAAASAAAALVSENNAAASEVQTAADVVSTAADAATAAGAVAQTSADAATAAAAVVSTAADAASTAQDAIDTAADVANCALAVLTTQADVSTTNANAALAEKWATEAEDVPVVGGDYSAFHWAQKAEEEAAGYSAQGNYERKVKSASFSVIQGDFIDPTKAPLYYIDNGATDITATINVAGTSNILDNVVIAFWVAGTGSVTFAEGAGLTIIPPPTKVAIDNGTGSMIGFYQIGSATVGLYGDLQNA